VIDLFAGSGNTLYWMLRHLPGSRGVGFESDAAVFRLTWHNIATLALPIDILNTDYLTGLAGISVGLDELLILFIAPPWGDAFDRTSGVDLRRTTPPITKLWTSCFTGSPRTTYFAPSKSTKLFFLSPWPS
jgi:hypothetical protein